MGPLFMHGVSLLSLTTLQPGSCSSTIPLPHRPTLFPVLSAALCEYNSRDLDGTTQLSNGHTKHGAVPEAWGLALGEHEIAQPPLFHDGIRPTEGHLGCFQDLAVVLLSSQHL